MTTAKTFSELHSETEPSAKPVPTCLTIWFKAFGIMPLREEPEGVLHREVEGVLSILYKSFIFLLLMVGCVVHLMIDAGVFGDLMIRLRRQTFIVFSASTALLFIILQASRRSRRILHSRSVLIDYAHVHGCAERMAGKAKIQWFCFTGAVLVSLACHPALAGLLAGRPKFTQEESATICVSFAFFAITVTTFLGVAFYLVHVVNALLLMVDNFCIEYLDDPSVDRSFNDWNVLQAVLYFESASMEKCILMLVTSVSVNMLVFAAHVPDLLAENDRWELITCILPWLVQFSCIMILGCKASMVSYKCSRVPPFVNSLDLDMQIRQYLVDFILNSDAGFKVYDVTLDPRFMMYISYGVSMGALYFCTRLLGLGD